MLTAHYTNGSKARSATLIIVEGFSIAGYDPASVIKVSGKAEARKIAAERGAKCWNF